jgi:putative aldouronate transport system substrate-binding protein
MIMKRSFKAVMAIFLAVFMMAGLFVGCSKTQEPTPSAAVSAAPGASAAPAESSAPEEENGLLCEPGTEVSVWQAFNAIGGGIGSYNDSNLVGYIEQRTGVHLKFVESSSADLVANFNLMINSGDYTDIIRPGSEAIYPGGGDKAIQDGVYLRLNDLVDKYIPNYAAIRNKGGEYAKLTISDSGNIWSIWSIKDPAEYAWMGLGIRKDLLDKAGLGLPVTLEDWEKSLAAFRDGGIKYPLILNSSGVMYDSEFLSAWNIGKDMYQVDGKVKYGYVQPEFKEYLTLMNKWYADGLIDQDFVGKAVTMVTANMGEAATQMNLGNVGAMLTTWGFSANRRALLGVTENKDMWISAVKAPVKNAGDEVHFRFTNYVAAAPNVITTSCKNPELVAKLFNYLYSEEGSILINYGEEGVSYTMADGKPRYTDVILHDPNGLAARDASFKYVWDDGIGVIDFKRLWQTFEETAPEALKAYDVWNSDGCDYVMPPISLTTDEGSEYSAIMGDINTFVSESVTSFIMGLKPLSDFDSFVNQLKTMNIERAIEIQQAALDRFNAR